MKLVCIDYGKSRIGLASCDITETLASPIGTVNEKFFPLQLEKTAQKLKEHGCEKFIIGLPLNMDGSEGESAALVREFAEKLSEQTELPYEFIDERLSTVSAHIALNQADMSGSKKRRQVVDTVAAMILMQAYLDRKK